MRPANVGIAAHRTRETLSVQFFIHVFQQTVSKDQQCMPLRALRWNWTLSRRTPT